MSPLLKKETSRQVGASPGTPIHLGEKRTAEVRIHQVTYAPETYRSGDIPITFVAGIYGMNLNTCPSRIGAGAIWAPGG